MKTGLVGIGGEKGASQKMGLLGAEVEIAGGVFFHLPQRDKSVFRWSGKGVGPCREALLPLPP